MTEKVKVACSGLCTFAVEVSKQGWDGIAKNKDGKAKCPCCNTFSIIADDQMYLHNVIEDDMGGDIL